MAGKERSHLSIRNSWSNQYIELPNQSLFHEKVRAIFCQDTYFKNLSCYQEIPVVDIVPGYTANHRFDWFIDNLNIVIELHGNQHYHYTNRGNKQYEVAYRDWLKLQLRDRQKKEAAELAGYCYIEIPYKEYERLNCEKLKTIILGT